METVIVVGDDEKMRAVKEVLDEHHYEYEPAPSRTWGVRVRVQHADNEAAYLVQVVRAVESSAVITPTDHA